MSRQLGQGGQLQTMAAGRPVQDAGPERSGSLSDQHRTSHAENQVAQVALQNINTRIKVAQSFQLYRTERIPNTHDVTVTSDPESVEEKICFTLYENKKVVPLTVKNYGVTPVCFTLWASNLIKNIFSVQDCCRNIIKAKNKYTLKPGKIFKILVHFSSDHAGVYEHLLVFRFETCEDSSDRFEIMRLLEVIHLPYVKTKTLPAAAASCDLETFEEFPPKRFSTFIPRPVVKLKNYQMPKKISCVRGTEQLLQAPLTWDNYLRKFQMLLHLEEHQQQAETDRYNQDNASVIRHNNENHIYIMKIASVPRGSTVNLSKSRVWVTPLNPSPYRRRKIYKGWVLKVNTEHVYMQLFEEFSRDFSTDTSYKVTFSLNRVPLRSEHRAAEMVKNYNLRDVLFPSGLQFSPSLRPCRPSHLNCNPEQWTAIQHIVGATAKPAPYLVFGPPGTGKTVTLVGAIELIVESRASCNILACAPSNNATDHLCQKILRGKINPRMVYRLYSLGFPVNNIPTNVKPRCNLRHGSQKFWIPPKRVLLRYKIVVTTLQTASRLVTLGMPRGHYSYIFVDEAGQATETECIVPIAGLMMSPRSQVVLAGDPKQLGPVISSGLAAKHGLGVSLLERLMTNIQIYKSHERLGFNNYVVTKLLRNYRSHPAILKIPNELFYKGELQSFAPDDIHSYCQWECLPKKGFPLIFHGVAGTSQRDPSSPSLYNTAEVDVLTTYVKSLIDHRRRNGGTEIKPGEIGIIAPYRKQVEKIQNALQMDEDLERENLENVLVGSVEQFQGKEFDVVLVSTVRGTPKLTSPRQHVTLGFVDDEKRFNVAITRARALLVVIGDPRALKTNKMWNKFIHYCQEEGGYRGITVADTCEDPPELSWE